MDALATGIVWISVGTALVLLIQDQSQKLAAFTRVQADARAALRQEIYDVCQDREPVGFYEAVAANVPDNLVYYALAETRQKLANGGAPDKAGACFAAAIMRLADENGCQLGAQAAA